MQKFTAKIVSMMKGEKLYHSQGGPIILSQVTSNKHINKRLFLVSKLGLLQIDHSVKTNLQ